MTDSGEPARGQGPAHGFPVVGMIGGGQLARMTQEAALALGVGLRVLAAGPGESAARGGGDLRWGAHDDPVAVAAFAQGCDVVTFDHEHVPQEILAGLVESGVVVRPGPGALAHAQDKVHMRAAISAAGAPCPAWAVVQDLGDVTSFAAAHSWPVVLKVSRVGMTAGAYGCSTTRRRRPTYSRGVRWHPASSGWSSSTSRSPASSQHQIARSPSGQVAVYPVVAHGADRWHLHRGRRAVPRALR